MNPRFLIPVGVFAALVVVLAVGINHSHEVGVLQSLVVRKTHRGKYAIIR